MVDADQIKQSIEKLGSRNTGKSFTLSDVAKDLDFANWEEIMERIRLVAEVMESQGLVSLEGEKITYIGSSRFT